MAVLQPFTGHDEMALPRPTPVPDELLWLAGRADTRLTRAAAREFVFDAALADATWADAHEPGRSWEDRRGAAIGWQNMLDAHAPVARQVQARWRGARAAMWAAAGGAALLAADLVMGAVALAG